MRLTLRSLQCSAVVPVAQVFTTCARPPDPDAHAKWPQRWFSDSRIELELCLEALPDGAVVGTLGGYTSCISDLKGHDPADPGPLRKWIEHRSRVGAAAARPWRRIAQAISELTTMLGAAAAGRPD